MTTSVFTMGYVVLAVSGIAVWGLARVRPEFIVPIGRLLGVMMQRKANRVAIFAIWWWIGWHFIGQPFPN